MLSLTSRLPCAPGAHLPCPVPLTVLLPQGHCTSVLCRAQIFPAAPRECCRRHHHPLLPGNSKHGQIFASSIQSALKQLLESGLVKLSVIFPTLSMFDVFQSTLPHAGRKVPVRDGTSRCPCDSQTLCSWRKSSPTHQKSFHTRAVVQSLPGCSFPGHGPSPQGSVGAELGMVHVAAGGDGGWRSCQGAPAAALVGAARHKHTPGHLLSPTSLPSARSGVSECSEELKLGGTEPRPGSFVL